MDGHRKSYCASHPGSVIFCRNVCWPKKKAIDRAHYSTRIVPGIKERADYNWMRSIRNYVTIRLPRRIKRVVEIAGG
jgi:hypothetical protein